MEFLPISCLQEIASHLDHNSIRNLKMVNLAWHSALCDSYFWINMCNRDCRIIPSLLFRQGIAKMNEDREKIAICMDYERIWVNDPFRVINEKERSVEDDNSHPDKFDYGISMECPPANCVQSPVLTSCYSVWGEYHGERNNVFILPDYGIPDWIMDSIRPRIVVSQWTTPTTGKECWLRMYVKLRSDPTGNGFELGTIEQFVAFQRLTEWSKVEIVLENYPRGMREIEVRSAGSTGQKMAKIEIRVDLPEELKWIGQRRKIVNKVVKKVEKKIDVEEKKEKKERKKSAKRKVSPIRLRKEAPNDQTMTNDIYFIVLS